MVTPLLNPLTSSFPQPPLPAFNPNHMALLVVDMQYFDAHPEWGEGRTAIEMGVAQAFDPYFAQIDAIILCIQELLTTFRHQEIEVIHIRVAEWTTDSRDVGWKQLVRGLIVPSNSKEAELLSEVAPLADELVVSKSSSGVFATTNFDRLLRNMGITTLVFTGTATGGCIESAVRDAVDLGYNVLIVTDACADGTPASHELALQRMAGGLVHLVTTAQVAERMATLVPGNRTARSGLERVKAYLPKPPQTPPTPETNPYSLIFPPALRLKLALDNSALVVVDAQCFACDPTFRLGQDRGADPDDVEQNAYYAQVTQALVNMSTLLATCRRLGLPVIHVRTAGQRGDSKDLSRHLHALGICPVQGTPAADFMPTVMPQSDEIVLTKPGLGIFTGTGIDEVLRNLAIDQLILTGISFAGGLEGSIRSASDRGYGVVIVPDACAAFHPLLQAQLYKLESGIINVHETAVINAQLLAMSSE